MKIKTVYNKIDLEHAIHPTNMIKLIEFLEKNSQYYKAFQVQIMADVLTRLVSNSKGGVEYSDLSGIIEIQKQ